MMKRKEKLSKNRSLVSLIPREYEASVIGAGYGGVISAAILAKNGLKTVLVDPGDQVGGKTGSVNVNGYLLDLGLKDARDTGDFTMVISQPDFYGQQAAKIAGAEIKMVPVQTMRCHVYPSGEVADANLHSEEAMVAYFKKAIGVPDEKIGPFMMLLAGFSTLDPQKYRNVIIKDWLKENVADEQLHMYLYRFLLQVFARPPEKASVGRIAEFFNAVGLTFRANDPEAGGLQGFIEPYARVIRKYGGEIMLGQSPVKILVDDSKVQGVVIADKVGSIQELHAPVVIFSGV